MGVLAKKNMLRILVVVVAVSLLLSSALARAGLFFEEKNTPREASGCSECQRDSNLDAYLKDKPYDQEITLFIEPECRFSDSAVNTLFKFKKDNPNWKSKGVIVTRNSGLRERLRQKQNYFSQGVEFTLDLNGNLAKRFSIAKTPTYLISYQGKYYKISGQPDLNEIIAKLGK